MITFNDGSPCSFLSLPAFEMTNLPSPSQSVRKFENLSLMQRLDFTGGKMSDDFFFKDIDIVQNVYCIQVFVKTCKYNWVINNNKYILENCLSFF